MAITRRQFVTRLGALTAAVGLSQAEIGKLAEAFGHGSPWNTSVSWTQKPKVIWVHGAECTGCSTSLLSLFEDVRGEAVVGTGISTAQALGLVGGGASLIAPDLGTPAGTVTAAGVLYGHDVPDAGHPWGHRTLQATGQNAALINTAGVFPTATSPALNATAVNAAGCDFDGAKMGAGGLFAAGIADVLLDILDVQYHETIMAAGGDSAYTKLKAEIDAASSASATPYVLVVEGAVQDKHNAGYWNKGYATGNADWCSIGMSGAKDANVELSFDDVVLGLATKLQCAAIIPIGQCACFGGYPACSGPGLQSIPGSGTTSKNMTGAQGVYDFLNGKPGVDSTVLAKVANSPGCPTNPWWFVLTTVLTLLKVMGIATLNGKDQQHRITNVYGTLLHSKYCPRYNQGFAKRVFASHPGEAGCLKNIGCKGLSTRTPCGRHGWNGQQPQNTFGAAYSPAEGAMYSVSATDAEKIGSNCISAGHPCMGCTEKGYPDAFSPFVVR